MPYLPHVVTIARYLYSQIIIIAIILLMMKEKFGAVVINGGHDNLSE